MKSRRKVAGAVRTGTGRNQTSDTVNWGIFVAGNLVIAIRSSVHAPVLLAWLFRFMQVTFPAYFHQPNGFAVLSVLLAATRPTATHRRRRTGIQTNSWGPLFSNDHV